MRYMKFRNKHRELKRLNAKPQACSCYSMITLKLEECIWLIEIKTKSLDINFIDRRPCSKEICLLLLLSLLRTSLALVIWVVASTRRAESDGISRLSSIWRSSSIAAIRRRSSCCWARRRRRRSQRSSTHGHWQTRRRFPLTQL